VAKAVDEYGEGAVTKGEGAVTSGEGGSDERVRGQ